MGVTAAPGEGGKGGASGGRPEAALELDGNYGGGGGGGERSNGVANGRRHHHGSKAAFDDQIKTRCIITKLRGNKRDSHRDVLIRQDTFL